MRECSFCRSRYTLKAEVRSSFITTTVLEQRALSHHKGATCRVRTGDRRTNEIQFYAIANLDKTSLYMYQSC